MTSVWAVREKGGTDVSRSTAILVGVASLLLLTWITVALRHQPIEKDLVQRVEQALSAYAISGVTVDVDGRDVRLSGEVSRKIDPKYAADIARSVWGVREVESTALGRRASMLDRDDPLNPRFDPSRIVRLGGDLSNPMDAGTCQRTMARLAAARSVHFEAGGASPMIESYPVLNDLATIVFQCPATRLIIGGHTDAGGDRATSLRLSQARAEAVERFFYLAGIAAERMQIVAYGDSQPVASNATAAGRAANRRITFDVLPNE
jgi:flagellar motor protein MotB